MRHLHLLVLCLLTGCLLQAVPAHADVVKPTARVTTWVNVRATPGANGQKRDILKPGTSLPLVAPGGRWHEVRLADGSSGFVASEWTAIERTTDTPVQPPGPPEPTKVVGGPGASEPLRVAVVQTSTSWLAYLPLAIALFSLLLALESARQTNLRSRNDTFRALRDRFETYRSANPIPPSIRNGSVGFKKTVAAVLPVADDQHGPFANWAPGTVNHAAENLQAFYDLRAAIERYWIQAFDEWYITTGGRGVDKEPNRKGLRQWRRRVTGNYGWLWDDYYRDVFTNTVSKHPGAMVFLWHACDQTNAPLDKRFAEDIWNLAGETAQKSALDALDAWQSVTTSETSQEAQTRVDRVEMALKGITRPASNAADQERLDVLDALKAWATVEQVNTTAKEFDGKVRAWPAALPA